MQTISDIFGLWNSTADMARAISAKPDTVRKWKKFRRIPQDAWRSVIDAALVEGTHLTVEDIIAANEPMKQRGRPAHKPRRGKQNLSSTRGSIPSGRS